MNQPHSERDPARLPVDPASELRNLQANSAASLAELREFLSALKGRKPQEVIGIVSASLLIQSLAISTVGTMAVLVLFTVGPYLIFGPPKPKAAAVKPAAAANEAVAPPATTKVAETNANPTPQPDAARAAKALGIDEAKPADPQKNPLDTPNFDKLLDGLDSK
jgi:hypothetical protein